MANQLEHVSLGASAGGSHALLITPSNTEDLPKVIRGIAFSGAGTLKVDMLGGETITFPSGAFAPGMLHPLFIKRVYATGTTVTDIVGVY